MLSFCLAAIGVGLLTHAYDSHRLILVALNRSHGEIERLKNTDFSNLDCDVECRFNVTPLGHVTISMIS